MGVAGKSGADEIEQNATPYVCGPPSFILGCADGIYLCKTIDDAGFLEAHSTEDGRCLWRVEAPQARALAIAGDLIFGSLHDVPVAWDRHTGEVVWRAAKSFSPVFHGIATENKVVYANTFGWLQCFEWSQPYHTPRITPN